MRGFHNSAFDPQTLVLLEAVFDEAWLTLISVGNKTVKPDELARAVLRLAMEGERDPIRLSDGALQGLVRATTWGARRVERGVTELAFAPSHRTRPCTGLVPRRFELCDRVVMHSAHQSALMADQDESL